MKAQISYDFLAIASLILFVFLILFEIYIVEDSRARIIENIVSARRIANMVARGVDEVIQTNGTSTQVNLPETLDTGDSYFLSIKSLGRRVDIFWPISSQNSSLSVPFLTSNVTDINISKTEGSGATTVTISNINGAINVTTQV